MFLPKIIDAGNYLVFNLTNGYGRWKLIAYVIVGKKHIWSSGDTEVVLS
jgi:hypothetical protein